MDNSQVSDAAADDCSLTELGIHATAGESFSAKAVFEGTSVQAFAAGMIDWFRDHGGENYITVGIVDRDSGQAYTIRMQREGGETPEFQVVKLKAEIQQKDEYVARLEQRLELIAKDGNGNPVRVPLGACDGIQCRDETIRQQDRRIARLEGRRPASNLPDPLGTASCTHPDCGRFKGPSAWECCAMPFNACARSDT